MTGTECQRCGYSLSGDEALCPNCKALVGLPIGSAPPSDLVGCPACVEGIAEEPCPNCNRLGCAECANEGYVSHPCGLCNGKGKLTPEEFDEYERSLRESEARDDEILDEIPPLAFPQVQPAPPPRKPAPRGINWAATLLVVGVIGWLVVSVGMWAIRTVSNIGSAIFGQARPVVPPAAKLTVRPPADAPVAASILGEWDGTFDSGSPAKLIISDRDGNRFSGRLYAKGCDISIEGTLPGNGGFDFHETKVCSDSVGGAWQLGTDTGSMSDSGTTVSGTGEDSRATRYQWSFNKLSPSPRLQKRQPEHRHADPVNRASPEEVPRQRAPENVRPPRQEKSAETHHNTDSGTDLHDLHGDDSAAPSNPSATVTQPDDSSDLHQ